MEKKNICYWDFIPQSDNKLNNFWNTIFDSRRIIISSINEVVQKIRNFSFTRLLELLPYHVKKIFGNLITRYTTRNSFWNSSLDIIILKGFDFSHFSGFVLKANHQMRLQVYFLKDTNPGPWDPGRGINGSDSMVIFMNIKKY